MRHCEGNAVIRQVAFDHGNSIHLPLVGDWIEVGDRQSGFIQTDHVCIVVVDCDRDGLLEVEVFDQTILAKGIDVEECVAKLETSGRSRW